MSKLNGRTILVVDDEEAVRDGVASGFERQGCRVLRASSGNEALELLRRTPVDALVSDIRMPNGTGIELLDGIRTEKLKATVIVMMTGFSDLGDAEVLQMGASVIFQKPFSRKQLVEAVESALEARQT